jgi:uncharacterized membrane protein (DUF485 family)
MSSDTDSGAAGPPATAPAADSPTGPPTNEEYLRIEADDRFQELRRRYRGFVFPATVGFLAWYLLYVLMSAYARGFLDTKVVGNFNIAFFFGLLQFVSTFAIAWLYSRYADEKLDPLGRELGGDEL